VRGAERDAVDERQRHPAQRARASLGTLRGAGSPAQPPRALVEPHVAWRGATWAVQHKARALDERTQSFGVAPRLD
jgi:hypothetical protein